MNFEELKKGDKVSIDLSAVKKEFDFKETQFKNFNNFYEKRVIPYKYFIVEKRYNNGTICGRGILKLEYEKLGYKILFKIPISIIKVYNPCIINLYDHIYSKYSV